MEIEDILIEGILIEGIIFDLDGTIYLGESVIPGVPEALATLLKRGIQICYVSNKPLEPRENYAAKLTRLGIPTEPDQVITSGYVMGRYLASHMPDLRLYVIGEQNLKAELRGHGLNVMDELLDQDHRAVITTDNIDAVIVAFDRTLDYRKLNTAYQALTNGAQFFATNPDKTCPMPGGGIPDAGATIAALEHLTGRTLDLLAGKPSPITLQIAMDLLGTQPDHSLMVGDRLETDIRMGLDAGLKTACVLTGASTSEDIEQGDIQPDLVIDSVADLPALLTNDSNS